MSKSKFIVDKLAKLFEQGLVSYKDLSSEILNILRSKRDEIVFKMKITSKEETSILVKRIETIEKKIDLQNNICQRVAPSKDFTIKPPKLRKNAPRKTRIGPGIFKNKLILFD